MDIETARDSGLDLVEELAELRGAACSRSCAVLPGRIGNLAAVERLNLGVLVHTQDDAGGRETEKPTTSCTLATKSGSVESLNVSIR